MPKYPEHIDQLDSFYQSQLGDFEIAPPEGLWDKISQGASEAAKLTGNGAGAATTSGSMAAVITKIASIGGLSLILGISTYFLFFSKSTEQTQQEEQAVPALEGPSQENQNSEGPTDNVTTTTPGSVTPSAKQTQEGNNGSSSPGSEEAQETPAAPVESTPAATDHTTVQDEPAKTDSIHVNKLPEKTTPKEKVKFKDKYKKDYQDSTRKLFLPGK